VVTLPFDSSGAEPHRFRQLAESFGGDPERYDRARRPGYPQALVDQIVAASPGREVLDVGIGTGIAAQAFQTAGCTVLGVDPDERMAEYARRKGFQVEVARFEKWEPGGRVFDTVVAGQTWHWLDPVAGAAKAALVLRPGGRLAVFWNAMELPPELGVALADAFRRVVPGAPAARATTGGPAGYQAFYAKAADGVRDARAFSEPERWQIDWERAYTRDEWLEAMATGGGFNRLERSQFDALLADAGAVIDAMGGSVTVKYATVAVTALRLSTS
jgi:SAM-dependent methyltransferase